MYSFNDAEAQVWGQRATFRSQSSPSTMHLKLIPALRLGTKHLYLLSVSPAQKFLGLALCPMPTPDWQWVISSSGLSSLVYCAEDRVPQSVGRGWGQPALFWALRLLGSVHASVFALIFNSLHSEWQQIFRNYKDCL